MTVDASLAATLARAEKGDVVAQCSLATLYELGLGVEKSLPMSFKWWSSAAANGNKSAQQNLVTMYHAYPELQSLYAQNEALTNLVGNSPITDLKDIVRLSRLQLKRASNDLKPRILIIDENKDSRNLTRFQVEANLFLPLQAASAEQGLDNIVEYNIVACFIEHALSNNSFAKVVTQAKKLAQLTKQTFPIYATAGKVTIEQIQELKELKIQGLFLRPLDGIKIQQALRSIAQKKSA